MLSTNSISELHFQCAHVRVSMHMYVCVCTCGVCMYVGVEDIFTCMEAQSGTGCLSSVFHIDNFRQGLSLNWDFTDQARLAEQ